MTPLKCVHLNSVNIRFILITILVSIFSQSLDCKPANNMSFEIFSHPPMLTAVSNLTEGIVHAPDDQQYQNTSVSLSTSKSETFNGNNNVTINPTTTTAASTTRYYLKEMDLETIMAVDNCTWLVK